MNADTPGGGNTAANNATQLVTDYGSEPTAESGDTSTVSAGITPEIVAVIEAAATAFVGRKIRILSVRILSRSTQDSSSWRDQGRDIIHTSHNLVRRGR
jgi:hypothetical protein